MKLGFFHNDLQEQDQLGFFHNDLQEQDQAIQQMILEKQDTSILDAIDVDIVEIPGDLQLSRMFLTKSAFQQKNFWESQKQIDEKKERKQAQAQGFFCFKNNFFKKFLLEIVSF